MGLGPWVSLALAADAWERHRVRKGQLRKDLLLRPVWPQRRLQGLLAIQVPASLQRVQLSVSVMLGLAHSRVLKSLSHMATPWAVCLANVLFSWVPAVYR